MTRATFGECGWGMSECGSASCFDGTFVFHLGIRGLSASTSRRFEPLWPLHLSSWCPPGRPFQNLSEGRLALELRGVHVHLLPGRSNFGGVLRDSATSVPLLTLTRYR